MSRGVRTAVGNVCRKWLGPICSVVANEPLVALTFDDGPHPRFTLELIRILAEHRALATFFMIGELAQRHPEIVREVASKGHAIGNHSWDHSAFPGLSRGERKQQLRRCQQTLGSRATRLFRPPFGSQSFASQVDCTLAGYTSVNWSCDVKDWERNDADGMAADLIKNVNAGAIVLLHDGLCPAREEFADRTAMLEAVRLFFREVASRFEFVTVPVLLHRGRPIRVRGSL